MKHLKLPLAALVASLCCLIAAGGTSQEVAPTTTASQQLESTTTGPSVITKLLRDKATWAPPKTSSLEPASTSAIEQQSSSESPRVPTATATSSSSSSTTTTTTTSTTTPSQTPTVTSTPQVSGTQSPSQRNYQFVRPNSAGMSIPATTSSLPSSANKNCIQNNRTYAIGQQWNDDCLQVCECVQGPALEAVSACRPRCPTYKDPPGDNCKLQRSKFDECCLDWACELDAKLAPGVQQTTQTTSTHTERGQLNLSTTEIKMPITTTTTLAPSTTLAPTKKAPTTPGAQFVAQNVNTKPKQQATTTTTQAAPTTPNKQRNPVLSQQQRVPKLIDQQTTRPAPTTVSSSAQTLNDAAESPAAAATTERGGDDERVDPNALDLCIRSTEEAYKVNDSWLLESCNRTCRCVFRGEPRDPSVDVTFHATVNMRPGSPQTEIRCALPNQCRHQLGAIRPSAECPAPRLKLPQAQQSIDSCECPEVTCATAAPATTTRQQQTAAPTTTDKPKASGCAMFGASGNLLRYLDSGETFNDECHSVCRCSGDGKIQCDPLQCPAGDQLPAPTGECSEWQLEPNFKPNSSSNKCCPGFVCKRTSSLESVITTSSSPSPNTEVAPSQNTRRSCLVMGREVAHGERVPEMIQPRMSAASNIDGPCSSSNDKVCSCQDGKIVCQTEATNCAPVGELPPEELECPADSVAYLARDESSCCQSWTCQLRETYELKGFQVRALNSSSVNVTLILPLAAVGRRGRIELNYTGAPSSLLADAGERPPAAARWSRRPSIRTMDGVFTNQIIIYYLNELKPQHRYWFKALVRFDDAHEPPFDEPLESRLDSVLMPAAESSPPSLLDDLDEATSLATSTSASSTGTTSTTTMAPTRILQPVRPHPSSAVFAASTPSSSSSPTTTGSSTTVAPTRASNHHSHNQQGSSTNNEPIIIKPDVLLHQATMAPIVTPCTTPRAYESNIIDQLVIGAESRQPLHWTDHMNGPLQRHAWLLLCALSVMMLAFMIVSYLYIKKSKVIAPISSTTSLHHSYHNASMPAYDNPSFKKLVSYYADQPHVLLVDESSQNYDNVAKQKNLEVDKTSPLSNGTTNVNNTRSPNHRHHHPPPHQIHHQNGKQNLI